MTTMDYNGTEIQLAKCTIALLEEYTDVGELRDFREKADRMYSLMHNVIGDELPELVEGDDYETCDLTVLVNLYNRSDYAYREEMRTFEREQEAAQQEHINDMANKVTLFNKAIENAKKNNPAPVK